MSRAVQPVIMEMIRRERVISATDIASNLNKKVSDIGPILARLEERGFAVTRVVPNPIEGINRRRVKQYALSSQAFEEYDRT